MRYYNGNFRKIKIQLSKKNSTKVGYSLLEDTQYSGTLQDHFHFFRLARFFFNNLTSHGGGKTSVTFIGDIFCLVPPSQVEEGSCNLKRRASVGASNYNSTLCWLFLMGCSVAIYRIISELRPSATRSSLTLSLPTCLPISSGFLPPSSLF